MDNEETKRRNQQAYDMCRSVEAHMQMDAAMQGDAAPLLERLEAAHRIMKLEAEWLTMMGEDLRRYLDTDELDRARAHLPGMLEGALFINRGVAPIMVKAVQHIKEWDGLSDHGITE